jgi:Rho GDP-dissociation inhibitor
MKSLIGDKDIVRPDGRRVVIEEFRIIVDGDAEDVVYKLNTPELVAECKKKPFELVEGCNWKLQLTFGCYGSELVAGLQFVTVVKKMVFSISDKLTIGSFAPNGKPNQYTYPRHGWNEAPSGMMKRGKYNAEFKLIDTDGKAHAHVPYGFTVVKKK